MGTVGLVSIPLGYWNLEDNVAAVSLRIILDFLYNITQGSIKKNSCLSIL